MRKKANVSSGIIIGFLSVILMTMAACSKTKKNETLNITPEEVIEKMTKRYGKIKSLKAKVEQEITLSGVTKSCVWDVNMESPLKLRIESTDGRKELINKKTAWVYQPETNQVIKQRYAPGYNERFIEEVASKGIRFLILSFEPIIGLLSDKNTPLQVSREIFNGNEVYVIETSISKEEMDKAAHLVPTRISKIRLWVDKEEWLIRKVEQYNDEGKVFYLRIYNEIQIDPWIPEKVFEFRIPPGAKVVEAD